MLTAVRDGYSPQRTGLGGRRAEGAQALTVVVGLASGTVGNGGARFGNSRDNATARIVRIGSGFLTVQSTHAPTAARAGQKHAAILVVPYALLTDSCAHG